MKFFLRNILIFLVLITSVLFLLLCLTGYVINEKSNFKLEANPKYLVIGHSHPQCAFNDRLINDFVNLSASGEAYFYTLIKAEKLIENNSSIEVVFIEFTNNQVASLMDDWTWKGKYLKNNLPKYSSFMNHDAKLFLIKKNFKEVLRLLPLILKKRIEQILRNDYNYSINKKIGGYLHLKKNKVDYLLKKGELETFPNVGFSLSNINYLKKIIAYCNAMGKKVILIRSPQHKQYLGFSNENKYQETLKTYFNDVEYIDFTNFPLKNSEFADLQHLNYKGASFFSEWFSTVIKKGLLNSKDMQAFIDREIQLIEK